MSRFFLLPSLLLSLLAAPLVRAQELSADEQNALVTKLQAHRAEQPALTAEFSEERTTALLKKPISTNGTIAFQAPSKFRRDLRGDAPSLTVSDGKDLWIYYPNFKQAEHYTLGQKKFFDDSIAALTAGLNFQNVDKFFRVVASREGSGHRVVLTPKSASLRRIVTALTVWMDGDGNIQKTDATLPKGDRVVTTYKNVRPAKTSDAKFEFTPPAGVEVTTPLGK
jgi:outer membrane lipoprotein carrier protein